MWLANVVPAILNSQAFSNGAALFIVYDETDDDTDPIEGVY